MIAPAGSTEPLKRNKQVLFHSGAAIGWLAKCKIVMCATINAGQVQSETRLGLDIFATKLTLLKRVKDLLRLRKSCAYLFSENK